MTDTRRALLDLLAVQPGLTQTELATHLGVSTRTARRHLADLEEDGTVFFEEDGPAHRYRLADHAHPVEAQPLTFTEGELEALAVAVLAARPLLAPTPLACRLDALAAKLRHQWLGEVVLFDSEADAAHWSFDGAAGGARPPADPAVFRALLDAVRGQHPVRATYHTASRDETRTDRRLAPLGFLVRDGAWLVPALDLDAPDHPLKDFALAGFCAVECLTDELHFRPDDFDLAAYADGHFGALEGEQETVRLLVEPEAVPYFRRKRYAHSQRVEEREDGRAVVAFEAGGLDAVKAWCLSWGPKVRVLAPASLAEQVVEAHREATECYADGADGPSG
jgi:predicted DNA-binding transcriptional regulator YafY